MTTKTLKRIKRLVDVKKRRVDLAGIAVSSARIQQEKQVKELEDASKKHEHSLNSARNTKGSGISAEDLSLLSDCVQAAKQEMEKERGVLNSIEQELSKQTDALLKVHKELLQMEQLLERNMERHDRELERKEQRQTDDLVAIKEAAK